MAPCTTEFIALFVLFLILTPILVYTTKITSIGIKKNMMLLNSYRGKFGIYGSNMPQIAELAE